MQYKTITKKNIRLMLDRFYSNILKDELIADFFIDKLDDEMISDEWQHHLNLLTDFWASILLEDTAYAGKPLKPHMTMQGLTRESFGRWLELFALSVDKFYEEEAANKFKHHSKIVADNFIKALKL
ncbi:MAG TPA: group III truncated hemoglobin [Sulfurimonas sp.]|nr:group III truncated hemoglobin [Sulfurimonas sp.]